MFVTGTHEWWLRERARKIDEQIEAEIERESEREPGTGLTGVEEIRVTSIFHVC